MTVGFASRSVYHDRHIQEERPTSLLIVNIGGEGETHFAGHRVLNVNNLEALVSVRTPFDLAARLRRAQQELIVADMQRLPLADGCADLVIGNRLPAAMPPYATNVAREVFRVLKPAARAVLYSTSGFGVGWLTPLAAAGLADVHLDASKRAIGRKP